MQEIAPPLALRWRHEDRQIGVAGEIARAADAVLDARAHHVGGVHVAVDVGLDHAVHGHAAQAADDFGMVADLLRAQHDLLAVVVELAFNVAIASGLSENAVAEAMRQLARIAADPTCRPG